MKELSDLKNEFYEVMYKYEKSFSEDGVMANLTAWQTAKADLISLLRHHPDWNEAEQAKPSPLSLSAAFHNSSGIRWQRTAT